MKSFYLGGFLCASMLVGGVLFGMSLQMTVKPESDDDAFMPQPVVSQKCCAGCQCGCSRHGFQCGAPNAMSSDGKPVFSCPACKKFAESAGL